jgi:hypothetical protein
LQSVPEPPVAVSVVLAPEQIVDGLADAEDGAVGNALTVTVVLAHVELPHVFSHRA